MIRAFKMLGGILWFVVAYVVIFVFTLLVEPQINPIKHFPVVTVSHKLILPTGPAIVQKLSPVLGGPLANTLVSTIWLVPGIFGFLVWELKENWRLYRANRPPKICSEPLGSHGETMLRLLRPGFHSGTLPKAFAALRRAVQRGESCGWQTISAPLGDNSPRGTGRATVCGAGIVEPADEMQFLAGAALGVRSVRASTNRIDVALTCEHVARPADPVELGIRVGKTRRPRFVQRAGWTAWKATIARHWERPCRDCFNERALKKPADR